MKLRYLLFTGVLASILLSATSHAATYDKIIISGETVSSGIYDPSIQYTTDGSVGYMAYTACDNWPLYIHTHMAKTTDHGQTWTFVQQINTATPDIIDVYGVSTTGVWHHETSTLIHDPDDPGREWKLYWSHHFFREPYNPSTDKVWTHGWIGYKYTSNPEGAWSAEVPLFGAGPYPPAPYPTQIDLNALDPRLAGYIVHLEPGGLYLNSIIYMAFQANTANREEQILHLIKSMDHGLTWSFVDVLANSSTAVARGVYQFYSAPGLVHEAGRTFLFLCPGSDAVGARSHDGTDIVEFVDLDNAQLTLSGNGPALEIYKHLSPSYNTFNSGESEYDAFNTGGGIIYPQFQATPPYEFELYNTHEPLLYTPTATPTVTPTSSPAALSPNRPVLAFPNPGKDRITFQTNAPVGTWVDVHIFNLAGERISQVSGETDQTLSLTWNCADIAPGVYVAIITLDGQVLGKLKIGVIR